MRTRLVICALILLFLARWWAAQPPSSGGPPAFPSLAQRAQALLEAQNLTGSLEMTGPTAVVRPGLKDGTHPKRHPVVIIPGIISCGLEVWQSLPCLGDAFFRRRIWGDFSMAEAFLANRTCWLQHISPDPATGLDREGIKVRASKGLKGADYFVRSYWLWAKMIRNLADIGYFEDDIHMACYDWRLAFPLLEKRDRYFTGLRHDIEKYHDLAGEKVVILAHSMGTNVFFYFMSWVERVSPGWVERHICSVVNIAGSLLGAVGPLGSFLSGEMGATATLGPLGNYLEILALTFDQAREVYWSMGGVGSILPMGGSPVWGSSQSGWTDTPVDTVEFDPALGGVASLEELYAFVDAKKEMPLRTYPAWTSYDRGIRRPGVKVAGLDPDDPRRFANPLATALPKAPSLKIFCLYGTGLPTERAYKYTFRPVRWAFAEGGYLEAFSWSSMKPLGATIEELRGYLDTPHANQSVRVDSNGTFVVWPNVAAAIKELEDLRQGGSVDHPERWIRINNKYHSNDTGGPWGNGVDGVYSYGVAKTDGDGTVPLVSLGYMCRYGWRDFPELNPANVSVWAKEFRHEPVSFFQDARGGPTAARHVEIIGNSEVIADVLKVAAGVTEDLQQDRILSNLTRIGPIISERLRNVL